MNVDDWPLSAGGFVYLQRPGLTNGWYFVWKEGKGRLLVHEDRQVSFEALCLELDWRMCGGVANPLASEVVETGDEE